MKKYQIYASIFIFAFLMGLKLFMPDLTESIREYAFAVVDIENKYKTFVKVLGDKLNDDELRDELVAVLGIQLGNDNEDSEDNEDLDEAVSIDDTHEPKTTTAPKRKLAS